MTRPAWDTLTLEQQRAEWDRYLAWQAQQAGHGRAPVAPSPAISKPSTPRLSPAQWFVGILGCVVLLALVLGATLGDRTTTLRGDMTVVTNTNALTSIGASQGCITFAGYDDIAAGAPVTVRDASGSIVGVGTLAQGQSTSSGCVFSFSIADVPESDFYSVEVTHRGSITVAQDEARTGVHMTLGA